MAGVRKLASGARLKRRSKQQASTGHEEHPMIKAFFNFLRAFLWDEQAFLALIMKK